VGPAGGAEHGPARIATGNRGFRKRYERLYATGVTATAAPDHPRLLPAPLEGPTLLSGEGEAHGGATAVAAYLARLAPSSRRKVLESLTLCASRIGAGLDAANCPWERVRYPHAAAVRAWLAERCAPATANRHLAALRGVLRECWRLGLVDADSFQRAVDVPSVRAETLPRGRALQPGELRALFAACADSRKPSGVRDAALLSVLYGAGLRRAEAADLDLADYDPASGALTVRCGKGRKDRLTYVPAGGRAALAAWLELRGQDAGPLFCPITKGGRLEHRRMTDQAVADACQRQAAAARLRAFSPHDLRRSYVSHLLDAGADLATVRRLAGHAQVTTTTRYDRRGEDTKRQATELLHVPYAGR
jgi:site-specific recombinase XerD